MPKVISFKFLAPHDIYLQAIIICTKTYTICIPEPSEHVLQVTHPSNTLCSSATCFLTPVIYHKHSYPYYTFTTERYCYIYIAKWRPWLINRLIAITDSVTVYAVCRNYHRETGSALYSVVDIPSQDLMSISVVDVAIILGTDIGELTQTAVMLLLLRVTVDAQKFSGFLPADVRKGIWPIKLHS